MVKKLLKPEGCKCLFTQTFQTSGFKPFKPKYITQSRLAEGTAHVQWEIIKLRQAYTEPDLSFRFVIYAGLRFSCKYFACPNKYNCILVFTVSGVFEHQHTLQPCCKGFGACVWGQCCNLEQDWRKKSCEKSPPGWDLPGLVPDPPLTSLTCLPGLRIALPHCCGFAQPLLGSSWCHQGCSAHLAGVLQDCAPTDTESLTCGFSKHFFQKLNQLVKLQKKILPYHH